MDEKRVLLKEPIKLQLNDFIEETDRFNPQNFTIWKIVQIEHFKNYMELECYESHGKKPYEKGYTCHADITAHYGHYKTKYLTYYYTIKHPLKVLYGK